MIDIWNPESSKWAVQASKKYKIALERRRQSRPKDWFDEPDKDRRIKRKVEIEHCGCQREILAHKMVDFEGIKANLKELPEKYPDWVLRLYYDLPEEHYL